MTSVTSPKTDLPPLVVAIDGPSGSGKSSTARGVAHRLGLQYLDTGSMYRAVAWAALQADLDGDDHTAIEHLARQLDITVGTDPQAPTIGIGERDITAEVREPRISAYVSNVATLVEVRALLIAQMRQIVQQRPRIVVEGRDITTVVCPQAAVRVLLIADPDARIRRRERELAGAVNYQQVREQVLGRDARDATVSQFGSPASGVVLIDSTELTLDEVIDEVCRLVPIDLLSPSPLEPVAAVAVLPSAPDTGEAVPVESPLTPEDLPPVAATPATGRPAQE